MKKLNRNEWMAVALGIVFVAVMLFGGSIMSFFRGGKVEVKQEQTNMKNLPTTGYEKEDVIQGTGDEALPGDVVTVHYVGALPSGRVFDSSLDRNQPFSFVLGEGRVIRGWEEGVVGMKVGGVRRLYIAPDYAYGSQAVGSIPANSTLIFEVQLLKTEKQQ